MVAVESISFEGRLSELLPDGSDWREHAVCKGRTRLFFPPKAERPQARARREAQALFAADPGLKDPNNARLRRQMLVRYGNALDLSDVG